MPIKSYQCKADIIFCPDIIVPVWGRGRKIGVIHDAFFWENPEHYQPLWRKYFLGLIKLGLRGRTEILTITEFSKGRLKQYLPHGTSIEVVMPATHLIKKNKLMASMPLGNPYFLHVGVMEKRKNLSLLLESFKLVNQKHPEVNLVLVGQRGPRVQLDDFDRIIKLIKDLDIEQAVHICGYVSNEKLDYYYSNALAYVFPSKNEGFGLPVLEAFSYELPVIITQQGALLEVGGDAVLISEDIPEKLAEQMEKVYLDEQLRVTLAAAGIKRLMEFSPEKFFISLKKKFNKV